MMPGMMRSKLHSAMKTVRKSPKTTLSVSASL